MSEYEIKIKVTSKKDLTNVEFHDQVKMVLEEGLYFSLEVKQTSVMKVK